MPAPFPFRFVLPMLLVAGCAASGGEYPSLNPRPGEVAPMVPRPALGCSGCGNDITAAATAPAERPSGPADAAARFAAIDIAIAAVETQLPAQARTLVEAEAAARGTGDASDAAATAETERSRFAALFVPLAGAARQLDDLEDDLAGTTAEAANAAAIATFRARLDALDAARQP